MAWLAFGMMSVLLWGVWGFMGKVALKHLNWIQVSLWYGISIVSLFAALLVASRQRDANWNASGMGIGVLTGLFGAGGLVMFYLALDRGKASVVVPMIGIYPVLTAVLAVVFLGERLSPIQIAGIGLAMLAVVLISLGR